MDFKDFRLEVKDIDVNTGAVEGWAAIEKNVDRQGDMVMPGAFTKTLAESGGRVPLLWQHDQRAPVGIAELTDRPGTGLYLRSHLDLDVEDGKRAYSALRKGYVNSMSIGYSVVKSRMAQDVRQLLELKLYEVSLVTVPANPEAIVTSVKRVADVEEAELVTLREAIGDFVAVTSFRVHLMKLRLLAQSFRR